MILSPPLSVSAIWGRVFKDPVSGKTHGHVMDPRTGYPTGNSVLSAVTCTSATDADALSTALLILGKDGIDCLATSRPELGLLLVEQTAGDGPAFRYSRNFPAGGEA